VISDKHSSTLQITNVDAQGKVTGTIKVSATETHNISGTWDATKNELSFTYWLNFGPGPIFGLPVTFTGYWFHGASQQLFQQAPGNVPAPYWDLLAGTYQSLFSIIPAHPHAWVARLAP
jgi:hypothetical protein